MPVAKELYTSNKYAKNSPWKATTVANLLRWKSSKICYANFKVNGRVIRKSLDTTLPYATDPSWWSSPGTGSQGAVVTPEVVTNDGVVTTNYITNEYAVVVQGQLKQFTARAVDELNAHLSNGAGTNLNTMVSNWAADYRTNGYNATISSHQIIRR